MEEGETRSFSADEELVLAVADGGAVQVTVAGRDLGAPGRPARHGPSTFTLRRTRVTRRDDRIADAVSRSVRVEVVGVGTELLLGQIANTNARWIGERLAEIGADVLFHQVVGRQPRPHRRGAGACRLASRRRARHRRARARPRTTSRATRSRG